MKDLLRKIYRIDEINKYIISAPIIILLAIISRKLGIAGLLPSILIIFFASIRLVELVYLKDEVIELENLNEKKIRLQIILCLIGFLIAIISIIVVEKRGYL